jgi:hypothetical protein
VEIQVYVENKLQMVECMEIFWPMGYMVVFLESVVQLVPELVDSNLEYFGFQIYLGSKLNFDHILKDSLDHFAKVVHIYQDSYFHFGVLVVVQIFLG